MPTYLYKCPIHGEFEEYHSITIKLEKCTKCIEENLEPQNIERLISDREFVGKDIVELTGQDLVDKVKADARQIKKDISKDANKYANVLGEARYQQLQTQIDKRKRG